MHVTESATSAVTNLHKYRQATQRGILAIASLFGIASAAIAGTNTWTSLGPSGGAIYDLAFHPTDAATMYAATSAGFYHSSDAGGSWQNTSADGLGLHFRPTWLAVDPSRPDRVLTSSGPSFALFSVDRGLTLQVTNGYDPTGSGPITAAADGSAIYYAVEGRVYRSTDGGASRQLRGSPFDSLVYALRVDPSDAQTIYATNYFAGVYRSTDGGANWTNIYTPANQNDGVWTMTIDPQNASRFWMGTNGSVRVSADAGATWQTVLSETGYDIDVDPRNAQLVYVATLDGRVMRTTDGGTTWVPVSLPAKASAAVQTRLAIHPADSAHLYLFGIGIFESLNGGASWAPRDNGIMATSPRRFSPAPTASGHFFVPVIGHGVVGVRPGDERLEYSFTPRPGVDGGPPPDVTAILSLPTKLIAAFRDSRVAISSDLGATWTMASADPPALVSSLAAANGGAIVYAATDEGLYRSQDYGDYWTLSSAGLPSDADVGLVAVAANQTSVYATVAVGTSGHSALYRSLDGGQSWSLTPTALEKRFVSTLTPHPTDAQTLIVGTNEGAFKTTDGGNTWQAMELHPGVLDAGVSVMAFDPTNPNIIYFDQLSFTGNMHRSVDGGRTFQKITPDYYEGEGAVSLAISPDHPHRLLASVPGGGVRQMFIMPDLHLRVSAASETATPNSQVAFTMTATNRGPFDATDVVVEARLPSTVSGTSATGDGSTCAVTDGIVSCRTDILRTNQAVTIRVVTTPTALGSLVATTNIRAAQPDSATGNNSAAAAVLVSTAQAGGSGGGGGKFDVTTLIGLLSLGLWRRRRRLYE